MTIVFFEYTFEHVLHLNYYEFSHGLYIERQLHATVSHARTGYSKAKEGPRVDGPARIRAGRRDSEHC